MDEPYCVYVDALDTVYVCDSKNNRIQKWTSGASTGTTVAGHSGGNSGSNSAKLDYPTGLTFDKNGDMYVVDQLNNRVQKFSPPSSSGATVANGLDKPTSVAVDDNLNVYVTDTENNRVLKFPSGSTSGSSAFSGGSFDKPYGITFQNSSSNQIYVSDISNKKVQLWTIGASSATSTVSETAGGTTNFNEPGSIIVDPYGNIYVADYQNKKVKRCCAGQNTCHTVIDGDSSPILDEPRGIAFDSNLNLYVTSKDIGAVYKYQLI